MRMRVTLVTQASELNGSAYFRALQFAPLLERRGLEVVLSPAGVAQRRVHGRAGAGLLAAEHGLRYVRRARELGRLVAASDAVMVQRGSYPIGPPWLLRDLRRFPGRLVFDLDDAVFLPSPAMEGRGRIVPWIYKDRQALTLLERADTVIVSTPELDASLPGRRADVILPTIPNVAAYPLARHDREPPLRLGWIGSSGNVRYLDPLASVLGRLERAGVARLQVISSAPWWGPSSFRRWERAQEQIAVADLEVGLMPLPDDPYTRAKAGFKLLQYMAAGCAVIASPVGVSRRLVEESGAGLLASAPAEWEQAVRALASDPAARAAHGANGRRFVREFANLCKHADVLAAALRGSALPQSSAWPSA